METKVIIEVLAASVRVATPLLFAALGGLLSESAGTFAVGIEGMMLMGAFGGAIASLICHSAVAGLLASAISGATIGTIVAVATARFRADQMVTGLAINIFAFGLTSFLLRGMFGGNAPAIVLPTLGALPIPFLSRLPIIGPVLFAQPALTYAAFVLAFALQLFLTKTRARLEYPRLGSADQLLHCADDALSHCTWRTLRDWPQGENAGSNREAFYPELTRSNQEKNIMKIGVHRVAMAA